MNNNECERNSNKKRKQGDFSKFNLIRKHFLLFNYLEEISNESESLPFGIANVLQITNESRKISPTTQSTFSSSSSSSSVNPWLMAIHHLSQSSSTAALANASNWCAKCSIQFRLTSELVHHIRVHHATRRQQHLNNDLTPRKILNNSSTSMNLICHICYETFRERHHLTRHMISHR